VLRASILRSDIDVVAINHTCATAKDLIHLIRYDSTLGSMHAGISIVVENEHLITVDGKRIRLISERDPKNIDWHGLDVDYVVESTGKFTKRSVALEHVTYGRARRVIISAPSSDSSTYVFGVNSDKYFPDEDNNVISCASCTTNCVTPVLKVLNNNFGVEQGLLTTVHASTQSQNVLDGYNKNNPRLGKALLIIVVTIASYLHLT
jgi:glyceraldehyde 3-phosphate dehydrogenase